MTRESKLEEAKQNQQRDQISKTIASLNAPDVVQNGALSHARKQHGEGEELPVLAARSATFPAFSSAVQIKAEPGRGRLAYLFYHRGLMKEKNVYNFFTFALS